MDYLKTGPSRYRSDGLNSLKCKVRWIHKKKLYTWIMVDINETDVRRMFPPPEIITVMPLDQAEGAGNEARRRMKEKEDREREWANKLDRLYLQVKHNKVTQKSVFDADNGEDIQGGLTIVSSQDLRRAKERLRAQEEEWLKNKSQDRSQHR